MGVPSSSTPLILGGTKVTTPLDFGGLGVLISTPLFLNSITPLVLNNLNVFIEELLIFVKPSYSNHSNIFIYN